MVICVSVIPHQPQKSKERLSTEEVAQMLEYQDNEVCRRLREAGDRSVPHTAKPENLLSIKVIRMENALLMTHRIGFFLDSFC